MILLHNNRKYVHIFTFNIYCFDMAKRDAVNTKNKTSRSDKTSKRLKIKKEMLAAKAAKLIKGRSKMN